MKRILWLNNEKKLEVYVHNKNLRISSVLKVPLESGDWIWIAGSDRLTVPLEKVEKLIDIMKRLK